MKVVLVLLQLISHISIHQVEYERHLKEASWAPIMTMRTPYTPLKIREKGLKKLYYGYLPYWVDTLEYQYFDMELLSRIAYFSIGITPGTGDLGSIPNAERFYKIRDYAHPRGVEVDMTFTIFGTSNVSTFLNSPSARSNAINAIKNFITNYGVDGVNIDFEFVTSSVRDSFSKFINDLAYELWNHPEGRKELYIAMPAVPEWYPGYDYAYLSSHSDGLFVMAYDFHYGGADTAGPVSPTVPSYFWGTYSVAKTIGSYKVYGADPQKIIIGVPYYGYDWPTESGNIGSSTTGYGSAVIYRYAYANALYYGRRWDSYSLTPWYAYSSSGVWHQCWYDDSVSLDLKFSMVNDSGLLGAGCWALGYDGAYSHIWSVIRKNFWIEPPKEHWVALVNTDYLNAREGPGMDYPVITTVQRGEKFVAFDYTGNWYKIYYPSGEGYYYAWCYGGDGIIHQFLKGSAGDITLVVNASLLNVREGPGTTYNIITEVTQGQVFVADSISDNWARIYLPDISGHTRGWISLYYARMLYAPEDSNQYDCEVLNISYPAEVSAGDTFNLTIKVLNNGFAPFDNLVYLKSSRGVFYNPETWADSQRAALYGYNGVPNQTFYLTAKLKAPFVLNDTVLIDTFEFERKGRVFGEQIVVSVLIHGEEVKDNTSGDGKIPVLHIPQVFRGTLVFTLPVAKEYRVFLYDITGRKRFYGVYFGREQVEIGSNLERGIYYIFVETPDSAIMRKRVLTIE